MAGEENDPQGELFVSLEPTIEELRSCGGRYQSQQIVIQSIIEEFGFDREAIVQIPPRACFQINSGTPPFLRTGPDNQPAAPGETLPLGHCIHLGYVSNFLIIRGVP
jgi:hypothetical protein